MYNLLKNVFEIRYVTQNHRSKSDSVILKCYENIIKFLKLYVTYSNLNQ